MTYRPTKDRVLIQTLPRLDRSASGLWLDQADWKVEVEGIVVAKGPKVSDDLNVGDHALFSWRMGLEFTFHDRKYLVMRESDVLGVLERTV